MFAHPNITMPKTVRVACSEAPGGFYIQDEDKVPPGAKLYKPPVTKFKPNTKGAVPG